MEISELVIGVLLFSAIIIGMSTFYSETATANGMSVTDYSYINQTNDITNRLSSMTGALSNSYDPLTTALTIPATAYNVITLFLSLPSLFTSLATTIVTITSTTLHIPAWASQTVLAIISVIIIFGVINAIFGKKGVTMVFANPTNISSPVNLFSYLNTVTNITTMDGTTITTGIFGVTVLLGIFAVFFLAFKERFETNKALTGSLFITSIISYLFNMMGFIESNVAVAITILTAVSIFLLFTDK